MVCGVELILRGRSKVWFSRVTKLTLLKVSQTVQRQNYRVFSDEQIAIVTYPNDRENWLTLNSSRFRVSGQAESFRTNSGDPRPVMTSGLISSEMFAPRCWNRFAFED
jgi:hypothetical protein